MFEDILTNDAFSVANLTQSINEIDFIPGRAGAAVFQAVGRGIETTTATVEVNVETLTLVASRPRGAAPNQNAQDRRKLHAMVVPHFPLADKINAHEVLNVRAFGQERAVKTVQQKLSETLQRMLRRHETTAENLRLGALLGEVRDADGSVLVNLYQTFGIAKPAAVSYELDVETTEVRTLVNTTRRGMIRAAKLGGLPPGAGIHAFCGDDFFDAFINHPSVEKAYANHTAAIQALGGNYVFEQFPFAGITFENYQGTDNIAADKNTVDGGGVGIKPNEARFFFTGLPQLYDEVYAPGTFLDAIGTTGLPRYASTEVGPHGRCLDIHTEMNMLPLCNKPGTLFSATLT